MILKTWYDYKTNSFQTYSCTARIHCRQISYSWRLGSQIKLKVHIRLACFDAPSGWSPWSSKNTRLWIKKQGYYFETQNLTEIIRTHHNTMFRSCSCALPLLEHSLCYAEIALMVQTDCLLVLVGLCKTASKHTFLPTPKLKKLWFVCLGYIDL